MTIHFLTFGSEPWRAARERAGKQAAEAGFDRVHVCDETMLGDWPHREWAKTTRGHGYWGWKPWLAFRVMTEMKDGDLLLYSDAGNLIRPYRAPYADGEGSVLGWNELRALAYGFGGCFFVHHLPEEEWTKGDLLARFDRAHWAMRGILWAGAWFMLKDHRNMQLLRDWNAFFDDHHLVDDSPSKLPNATNFIEHRHDQSVLSLLVKERYDLRCLVAAEPHQAWTDKTSPIYCARSKT